MGNLERLLEALARKLPASADRAVVVAALRAAREALPESQAKTRARLLRTEAACAERLLELLREAAPEAAAAAEEPSPEEPDEAQQPASTLYQGVDEGDPGACLARCAELLRVALCGLRPAAQATEALEGLLALLWPGLGSGDPGGARPPALDASAVRACASLVPAAAAALGEDAAAREGLPAWGRLLGLLLAAPWRVRRGGAPRPPEADGQLGSLVALVAGPLAARAALRVGLEPVGAKAAAPALRRAMADAAMVVPVAFGPAALAGLEAGATTDDLLALLRTARLSGLCRAAGAADERALEEVDGALRAALEGGLDATAVVPHLAALAPGEPIGRRLAKGARSRAAAAALVLAAMRLPAAGLPTADLARLAGLAGLPAGHGEGGGRTDQRAAAARARGELFFEDVEGAGAAAGGASDSEGIGPDSAAAALEAVRSGALERLEGVEAIEGAEDGEPGGKKRARQPPGAEEDEGADGDDAGAAAVGSTPVKRRLRKKKKAVDDA